MHGGELLQTLARERSRFFTVDQVEDWLAKTPARVELVHALHRLEREGWLVRIKSGLYALAPEYFPGTAPVHEFELAMALVPQAAISHWSALQQHGLTDQLPRRVFLSVPAPLTPPRLDPRRARPWPLELRFIRVAPERFFGHQQAWVGETHVRFTDLERTLLDGLSRPQECGGFEEVLAAFRQAWAGRKPRAGPARLVEYALRLEPVLARRLGWVLEHLGESSSALLQPLESQAAAARAYQPLVPGAPRRGPCTPRWKLQENLPGREARS